jgi:hypothetical protein
MAGPVTDAIVAVIRRDHPAAEVTDRGSYFRVVVPGWCAVRRADVEAVLGRPFRLPGDLERVMTSFRGRFAVSADEASWTSTSGPTDAGNAAGSTS